MAIEITYDTPAQFDHHGRNGFIKACGIAVTEVGDEIFLNAIASRGRSDAARLVVPKGQIDRLIGSLTRAKGPGTANSKDYPYRDMAHRMHHDEGNIEVDAGAPVSGSGDGGAYVQAWVWVSDEDIEAGE